MNHGKTYNKSPRRINHKATKSKTNTGTTALERSQLETICMKCQFLFSGKIRKKYDQCVVCWNSPESAKNYKKIFILRNIACNMLFI